MVPPVRRGVERIHGPLRPHESVRRRTGASPDLCAVLDERPEEEAEAEEPEPFPEDFPFLAWQTAGEPRLYRGVAPGSVLPPMGSDLLGAVSVPESPYPSVREIELMDSTQQKITATAVPGLAEEVAELIENGEDATVRVIGGIATGLYEHSEEAREDWLEFIADGPGMDGLVLPRWLAAEFRRDAKLLALGRSFFLDLIGPTGVGKSDAVPRTGCDAVRLARKEGRDVKGLALIHLSASRIGSSYIYAVSRTIGRALKKAGSLAANGWICVVLIDEADALTGESSAGLEQSYSREVRLTLQSELSREIPGVGIYSTRNVRRNSTLPAAIARRARLRCFPRVTRSQMEAIAALYVTDQALAALGGMDKSEFGGIFADRLFRDREIAEVHLHSGKKLPVMARDLQIVSGGKAKTLINVFCEDIELGEPADLTRLWRTMDREIRAPDLTPENLFELTFLTPPDHDTVRAVVPLR